MVWRVLIVEDEYLIAWDIESAFLQAGAQTIGPIVTLKEALALDVDSFDAAVLDIQLQDGPCYPLALKLLKACVPFVLVTGRPAMVFPTS
jgi:DNA-binding response OmpR family regulator